MSQASATASHSGSAAGKVVLWGEYAVLAGAPAAAMAVDRYASCTLTEAAQFTFTTAGFESAASNIDLAGLLQHPPSGARLTAAAWQAIQPGPVTAGLAIHTNTEAFYSHGTKFGIGSSAAALVATYGALCRYFDVTPTLPAAMAAHRALQGGRGSGIDVASAWHGGVIRFQEQHATPIRLPNQLGFDFFFTGNSAATSTHLGHFADWRSRGQTAPLEQLAVACEQLTQQPDDMAVWMEYCARLNALDAAAQLGIYTEVHKALERLASVHQLVYKPCGAGGGDVGAIVYCGASADIEASRLSFRRAASELDVVYLPMESAQHGLRSR